MSPAPDQATVFGGLVKKSMSIPSSFNTAAMSPTDSMNSLYSLEKQLVGQPRSNAALSGVPGVSGFSRSATNYWGHATSTDMQQILGDSASVSPQEALGSGMVSSDWQQLLDAKSSAYKYPPGVSAAATPARGGIMENARIREMLTGRVGGSPVPHKSWSPLDTVAAGIAVDQSKGGLALHGVDLATSHCLAQFTSDPAFAERAAKFSSFGNGKYPQIALSLPVNDAHCKPRSRSSESGCKSSRTTCNPNSAKKSTATVAAGMEENTAAAPAAASVLAAPAAADRSCDMDVDGVGNNDKSPTRTASVPELEAIEGASLVTMDRTHELAEVAAGLEPNNSSSVTEQQQASAASPARSPTGSDDSDRRKRKSSSADKLDVDSKAADVADSQPKRCKGDNDDLVKAKAERSSSENSGDSGSPRAHKENNSSKDHAKQDYIHVRARRGQATDSHSLAERVRREKISERMKYLQDLVPGCSKVTGKAVMLDEIINYVQSLQRQVENLSMKLASVNPGPSSTRIDHNFETTMNKDMLQSQMSGSLGGSESTTTFGMMQQHQHQPQPQGHMMNGHCGLDFRAMGTSMDGYLRRSNSAPIRVQSGITSLDSFGDDVSQSIGWDGELQSIVNQMGFSFQGRYGSSPLDSLQCQLPVGHMKVEM